MAKTNCWEFKNCGREPRGAKVAQLGVCPASTEPRVNGLHGGAKGGRVCWAVTGTLCGGVVQGTFAAKLANCLGCEFYASVARDEGSALRKPREVIELLQAGG